ncbi:MAG TPA: ABC transporter ATP-binding protein [Firmicutes bacterium]|nr:ABC transporter ATP-binding protein [Bacillota bacterium]
MILQVENLNVNYGGIHALKDVSLEVEEGEIVTIIGANGAGKSSLLKTISGIVKPSSGKIIFMGQDITRKNPDAVAALGIAHVPEGRKMFANLTVLENLEVGAFLVQGQSQVRRNLEMVYSVFPRLKERSNQLAGTLSGGEQQMLAIARGLMMRPKLLMMDEPSLGLAPVLVNAIFEKIREINREGTTVLLVEQNAHKALKIAHRAYVLETGGILISGPAAQLASNPMIQKAYLGKKVG